MKKSIFVFIVVILSVAGIFAGSFSGLKLSGINTKTETKPELTETEPYVRVADNQIYLFDGSEWIDAGNLDELSSNDVFALYSPETVAEGMPVDIRTRTGVPVYVPVYVPSYSTGGYSAPAGGGQPAPPPSEPVSEWSDDFL